MQYQYFFHNTSCDVQNTPSPPPPYPNIPYTTSSTTKREFQAVEGAYTSSKYIVSLTYSRSITVFTLRPRLERTSNT